MRRTYRCLYHHLNHEISNSGKFNTLREKTILTKTIANTKDYYNEVATLKQLRDHRGIIQLLNYNKTKQTIEMPYYHEGDMLEYIKYNGHFDEGSATPLFKKILESLKHCHELNIVHGDIKPDNIVLDKKCNNIEYDPILIDFGHACILPHSNSFTPVLHQINHDMGTYIYMSPEAKNRTISTYSDIYSAGIVLYIMLTGKHPVISDFGELDIGFQEQFDINYKLVNLIVEMTDIDHCQRPSAEEILYMGLF